VPGGRGGGGWAPRPRRGGPAAVRQLVDSDWIDPAEEVVAFDTGIGHKYPPPAGLGAPAVVVADEDDLDRLARLLGVR
jgi:threonine synthase